MTTLNRLPILERRRIQAELAMPIYRELKAALGADEARRLMGRAVRRAATEEGRRFAHDHGGPGGIAGFLSFQHLWDADGALETETVAKSKRAYAYNVTRCRYAEMYRAMGAGEIGFLLSCNRDATFAQGYDPRIELTRTQTIMQGADHCDFRYRMAPEAPPPKAGA